jgi:hypothetical protein
MQLRQTLSKAWTSFNEWRVKGWPVRVIILLLIFSPVLYERVSGDYLISRLVGIAVEAIFNDCEPKLSSAITHYYNVRDIQRLRSAIRVHFDVGTPEGDYGYDPLFLRLEGISPAELSKPSTYANASFAEAERLAKFAKRYAIVRQSYSVKELRKEAFYAAQAEVQAMNKNAKDEIAATLVPPSPDYSDWTTWRNGIWMFVFGILEVVFYFAPFSITSLLIITAFFLAGFLSFAMKHRTAGKFFSIGIAMALEAMLVTYVRFDKYVAIALLLLMLAASLKGARVGVDSSCRHLVALVPGGLLIWLLSCLFLKCLMAVCFPGMEEVFCMRGDPFCLVNNIWLLGSCVLLCLITWWLLLRDKPVKAHLD